MHVKASVPAIVFSVLSSLHPTQKFTKHWHLSCKQRQHPVSGLAGSSPADAQSVSPGVLFTAIIIQCKFPAILQSLICFLYLYS